VAAAPPRFAARLPALPRAGARPVRGAGAFRVERLAADFCERFFAITLSSPFDPGLPD